MKKDFALYEWAKKAKEFKPNDFFSFLFPLKGFIPNTRNFAQVHLFVYHSLMGGLMLEVQIVFTMFIGSNIIHRNIETINHHI
jgi:fumarate reductase subunit D